MKKLTLVLCAMCFAGCYRADGLDGDPVECPSDCDDGIACTDDYCGSDGVCGHFDHCVTTECDSDSECEDGVDCTLDYCGADNLCHAIDECVEPACDEIRTIGLPTLGCGLDAASDGEKIILAWTGCDGDARGNISLFDPSEPPTELTTTSSIEEPDNELRKPFVLWSPGENPRLFWTAASSDSAVMMTGEYDISGNAMINRHEIWDSLPPAIATLNDVKLGPDGEYGLGFEVRETEITVGFGRWSAEDGVFDPHELIGAESYNPVLSPTETGWSIAYTVRGEDSYSVFLTEFIFPESFGEATTMATEPTMFATRAMINAGGTAMVLYERFITVDINQLFASWILPDDTAMALDLDWVVTGESGLDSSGDDPARASWCGLDLVTGVSSIHVSRLTTHLAETELWADLGLAGCADTELIRVGDDAYALWLTNDGLSYRNLSCR